MDKIIYKDENDKFEQLKKDPELNKKLIKMEKARREIHNLELINKTLPKKLTFDNRIVDDMGDKNKANIA